MKRRWFKRLFLFGVVSCLCFICLLIFPEFFLHVRNQPVPCDAIVVLGGQPITRSRVAATLATNGLAPRLIASGTGDCEDMRRTLQKYGVRTNIIELECRSTSTQENGLFTVKLLREHKCKRVIIVTSWFHSRRALSCFRKYAPEMEFISVPSPRTRPWKEERNYIAAEYAKMIIYALRYGIVPWE